MALRFTILLLLAATAAQAQPDSLVGSAAFWHQLENLCGSAFAGQVVAAPEGDTLFAGKPLIMHVRACEDGRIRIPFMVGDDRSRTWVLTRHADKICLKHDHRHADGSEDRVTQYGGTATHTGTATRQLFPADQQTADLLPAATANVWWIDLEPGVHFTYNLRRMGTDRLFSVRFDLTEAVPAPPAPW
jgi:hypothetical protein